MMDIYVYSDESGVFDKAHNEIFVFGGLIFLSKGSKDIASRKYSRAEKSLTLPTGFDSNSELKANCLSSKNKGKLFRSLNQEYRFGCVVRQEKILDQIFAGKKDKQRYLDYAYKIAVKRAFQKMINNNIIQPSEVQNVRFFIDEHSTATNGRYELREGLEQELKHGTYNMVYSKFYPPIFPKLLGVEVEFCNSAQRTLIRAADIIANKLYHLASLDDRHSIKNKFFSAIFLP